MCMRTRSEDMVYRLWIVWENLQVWKIPWHVVSVSDIGSQCSRVCELPPTSNFICEKMTNNQYLPFYSTLCRNRVTLVWLLGEQTGMVLWLQNCIAKLIPIQVISPSLKIWWESLKISLRDYVKQNKCKHWIPTLVLWQFMYTWERVCCSLEQCKRSKSHFPNPSCPIHHDVSQQNILNGLRDENLHLYHKHVLCLSPMDYDFSTFLLVVLATLILKWNSFIDPLYRSHIKGHLEEIVWHFQW